MFSRLARGAAPVAQFGALAPTGAIGARGFRHHVAVDSLHNTKFLNQSVLPFLTPLRRRRRRERRVRADQNFRPAARSSSEPLYRCQIWIITIRLYIYISFVVVTRRWPRYKLLVTIFLTMVTGGLTSALPSPPGKTKVMAESKTPGRPW